MTARPSGRPTSHRTEHGFQVVGSGTLVVSTAAGSSQSSRSARALEQSTAEGDTVSPVARVCCTWPRRFA